MDKQDNSSFNEKFTISADDRTIHMPESAIREEDVFEEDNIDKNLDVLKHLCAFSDNIIVVVSDDSSLHARLKHVFLESFYNVFKCCYINVAGCSNINDLMHDISAGFNIVEHKSTFDFAEYLADLSSHDDKPWVLLIEDAHKLNKYLFYEVVKLFYVSKQTNADNKLRLVLMGNLSLEETTENVKLQVGVVENTHVLELESSDQENNMLRRKFRLFSRFSRAKVIIATLAFFLFFMSIIFFKSVLMEGSNDQQVVTIDIQTDEKHENLTSEVELKQEDKETHDMIVAKNKEELYHQALIVEEFSRKNIKEDIKKSKIQQAVKLDKKDILDMPDNHYALQLLGTSKIEGMKKFIVDNKLNDKGIYYQTTHNHKKWYVFVYGNYSSRIQAKKALAKLPPSLRALHPWIREFSSIKKALQVSN